MKPLFGTNVRQSQLSAAVLYVTGSLEQSGSRPGHAARRKNALARRQRRSAPHSGLSH